MGWTLGYSDKTGRLSTTESFSGSALPAPFVTSGANTASTGVVTTNIDANRTLDTDQAGKQRISETNALGHLTNVWEVTPQDSETESVSFPGTGIADGYRTSYTYDLLNNLKTVSQGVQTRTFTYSSLSRLLTAANPESGTISYVYDNNGNLTSKTDARGVITSYSYDNVNRVISRSYANEPAGQLTTPTTTYTYDDPAIPSSKGKLTKVSSTRGSEYISQTRYTEFDLRGRIEESVQATPIGAEDFQSAPQRTMRYTYNLSGALIEETYPSARVVRNTIDEIGRLAIVESKKDVNSVYWNYASQFTFSAAGAVSSMRHGNGTWESSTSNARLQPTEIALGSTPGTDDLLDLTYTYNTKCGGVDNPDNNGNVLSQTIKVEDVGSDPGFDAVQTYSYDPLNRIKTAEEVIDESPTVSFKQTFLYDRYGNRNFDDEDPSNTTTLTWGCLDGQDPAICPEDRERENPEIDKDTNRIKEFQPDGDQQKDYAFDAAGNTILDPDGRQFFYDGENKQIKVEDISDNVIGEYVYDGDGGRVMKKVPLPGGNVETTVFIYNAGGKLVAEYSTTVGSQEDAQVSYLTNDHLGSPRITTDKSGKVYSRRDFLPFGEELDINLTTERTSAIGYSADNVRQKFTGYERDDETELDFAKTRYFGSALGRFTGPDDFLNDTHTVQPQSWNLYEYARNSPLKYSDPTGQKVKIEYEHDKETNTTRVKVTASFAIYSAAGHGISKKDLKLFGKVLKSAIKKALEKEVVIGGRKFVIRTDIETSVKRDENSAIRSGSDNIVEVGNEDLFDPDDPNNKATVGLGFRVEGEDFDRMVISLSTKSVEGDLQPRMGPLGYIIQPDLDETILHEFSTHLSGVLHSDDIQSVMHGDTNLGRFGIPEFTKYLGGDNPVPPPPLPDGRGRVPSDNILFSNGKGRQVRRATSVVSHPNKVYHWIKRN